MGDPVHSELGLERNLELPGDDLPPRPLDLRPDLVRSIGEIGWTLLHEDWGENKVDDARAKAGEDMATPELGSKRLRHFKVERLTKVEQNERDDRLWSHLVLLGGYGTHHPASAFI